MLPRNSYAIFLSLVILVTGEERTNHDERDIAELEAKWGFDVIIIQSF